MLLWLQKKLPKAVNLWIKLFSVATGFHLCLLFAIFFIYKGDGANLKLEINQHIDANALVVFLPLQKRAANQPKSGENKKGQTAKPAATKASTHKPLKLAKNERVPTCIAQVSTSKIKQPKAKIDKKKNLKKETPKKIEQKIEEKKKKIEKPKPEKKEELKTAEPKKDEPKIEEPKITDTSENAPIQDNENIRYIGQEELDAMCIQNSLTHAIAQHWKPPVGIAKNKVCELTLVIDWQGKVKDIKVEKTSGAAMYDVSARTAALAAEYPKALWGKACTITFKQ